MSHIDPSSRQWTPQQREAITATGSSLLVSAAAGSGKTSVLSERCAHLVCDAHRPCSIGQLLVVTFTEAAAAEMKSRIEQALRQRLAASGADERLRHQVALIEHANVSTLHSFCNRLLRQNFQRLGLDPNFRVLDADEAMLLRLEVARDLFDKCYDDEKAEAFRRLVDVFGEGDDQRLVDEVIRLHELLGSLLSPGRWIEQTLARLAEAADKPLLSSAMGRELLDLVAQRLADLGRDCKGALDALSRMSGFPSYVNHVRSIASTVDEWCRIVHSGGYDALVSAVAELKLPRLQPVSNATAGKDIAKGLIDAIQAHFKKGWLTDTLRFTQAEWQDGLRLIHPHAQALLALVESFGIAYRKAKDSTSALDFADLERFAFKLLCDGDGQRLTPSALARSLHRRFQHVLVDEYQDINPLQNAILSLVSRECMAAAQAPMSAEDSAPSLFADRAAPSNLFTVGDVKQSIYGFRLAEPSLFLRREELFRSRRSHGRVIDLQANFRSRGPLLESLNHIFAGLMTKQAVDVEYDQSHRLHPMAAFPPAGPEAGFRGAPIELHYLPEQIEAADSDEEETADQGAADVERAGREALLIAHRIEEMMGQHGRPRMHVIDRADGASPAPRPIEYRDIVILLRATRYHADEYADVLRQRRIPVHNDSGGGFFDSTEIRDVLSLLRLLDNRRQDIPLAAFLRSPLANLPHPEDAMARIRLAYPAATEDPLPFHEAVLRYSVEKSDELAAALRDLLAKIDEWRTVARLRPVAELIWHIYDRTGYLTFCSGLESGQQRCANLIELYNRARQFGTFSRQGLYRFTRFLESLAAESDAPLASELSAAQNAVRIMSVHRSKGLEFPVVILPQLGKRINFQSCSGNIVADREAGLGMVAIDEDRSIRYPSLASVLVTERLHRQIVAEELRVLYVATTRAKEHLILVGTCKEAAIEAWSRRWDMHTGPLPASAILGAKTMLDWLGPIAATLSGAAPAAIESYPHPAEEVQQWMASLARPASSGVAPQLANLQPLSPPPASDAVAQQVIERLSRIYPYRDFSDLPASTSVTTWTKSAGKQAASIATAPPIVDPRTLLEQPRCLLAEPALSPTDRGTAVHLFLEHLDFAQCCDETNLLEQLGAFETRKLILPAQATAVRQNLQTVIWFLAEPLGVRIRANPAALRREVPLNYAVSPSRFIGTDTGDPLDQVMIRGRIDLMLSDAAGFEVVDYKTDLVDGEALTRRAELYRPQVELYREAISRITARPVHTAHLVFLSARQIVTFGG